MTYNSYIYIYICVCMCVRKHGHVACGTVKLSICSSFIFLFILHIEVSLTVIFWDITPSCQVDGYQYLGGTCSHHPQGRKQRLHSLLKCWYVFTVQYDAASSNTVVSAMGI